MEAGGFERVGLVVVKFNVLDGSVFDPFDVAVARGAQGVAHNFPARKLADGIVFDYCGRIFEGRDEAFALQSFGRGDAGEFAEGGIDVDEFAHGLCLGGVVCRGRNNQRRFGGLFVVGVFAPPAVIAEMPAVVAPQDDDGVVGRAALVERVEQAADLRVGVGDAGVVGVDELGVAVGRQGAFGRNAGIAAQLAPGVAGVAGGAFGFVLNRRGLELAAVVEVPVFFRGDEGQVRLMEADGNKKRFPMFGKFFDLSGSPDGHGAVGVGVVGHIDAFERRAGV